MTPAQPAPLGRDATFAGRSVEAIRAMIADGDLTAGERLNEVHLSQALGISRGPLREAIQRLASEGLLDVVPHRGAFVRSFGAQELRDLYELRIAVETHAARVVARDAPDLSPLDEALDHAERTMQEESGAYPRTLDFHHLLLELTGNVPLQAAARSVAQQIDLARVRSGRDPGRASAALAEHRAIVEAMRSGNGTAAGDLLREHLEHSLANALAVLEAP